jgi:NADH-quinone oxidoreductase subunit M
LIGIWGSKGREVAAFRSIVSAAIGNALFFGALVLVYYSVDPHTFSLHDLATAKLAGHTFQFLGHDFSVATVAFALVSGGLALRAPIWPLHGWFTSVAEEAPPSVFVALSAVSVPAAAYIFVRVCFSLFPETVAELADGIVVVGVANLIMGGICAAAQRGLRLLLAFVCLSEVGLILIGIGSMSSPGVVGAVYQQFAVGLGIAGFGLFSGIMADRTGRSRFLTDEGEAGFGGIATRAPAMALVAGVVVASLLGFPGSTGFVGHALLMIGSYTVHPAAVILAGASLLLATYYLFGMYRYVFLGSESKADGGLGGFADLTMRERAYLVPLVGCLLFFGLYPKPLIELVRPTVLTLLSTLK